MHVILSKLPPGVVRIRGETEREAFDLAAGKAERATRRNMEKHGFSTHHHKHRQHSPKPRTESPRRRPPPSRSDEVALDGDEAPDDDADNTDSLSDAPASEDGADGAEHTAHRNAKLNTDGMPYALEDSATGKPSRKSSGQARTASSPPTR